MDSQAFFEFMSHGHGVMWVILCIFLTGVSFGIERVIQLRRYDVNASSFMNEIQKLVFANKIKEAIKLCSGTAAVVPQVLKNGLKRANQGTTQMQHALDATALEVVPKVEVRLNWLGFFTSVSTLLGLLGTIFGLIESFEAVAVADPSKKAEILSKGISTAMNTTAFGLISAISIMFIFTYVSSKAEKILNDIDQYGIKLIDLFGTLKNAGSLDVEED